MSARNWIATIGISVAVSMSGVDRAMAQPQPKKSTPLLETEGLRPREAPPIPEAPTVGPLNDTEGGANTVVVDAVVGTTEHIPGIFRSWHRSLSRFLPEELAWSLLVILLCAPLYVAVAYAIYHRRTRRKRTHDGDNDDFVEKAAPTRAKRSTTTVQALGADSSTKKEERDPAEVRMELTLDPVHEVLHLPGQHGVSIYETFVGVGPDADALRGFSRAAHAKLEPATWATAVSDRRAALLERLGTDFVNRVATQRLAKWLSQHPLVGGAGLSVQVPELFETSEVATLDVTRRDGLGAELSPQQKQLVQQSRKALAQVFAASGNPFHLIVAANENEVRALLGEAWSKESPYGLSLLLSGLSSLEHGIAMGLSSRTLGKEFREALAEHRRIVDTPVPAEGCALHAIQLGDGLALDGMGIFWAAVAGASFSVSSVVVRISQQIARVRSDAQLNALKYLGIAIANALEHPEGVDCQAISMNLSTMLGIDRLEAEGKRCVELSRLAEKELEREPLWAGTDNPACKGDFRPDIAIIELHRRKLEAMQHHAVLARQRLLQIIDKLSYAGDQQASHELALRRVGYVIAGIGMPLLRSTSTDLMSAGREAIRVLNPRV